jgi:hypothetical protein
MGGGMTVPSDFDSYWAGFELTAANYSGGAGGTFANLAGGQDWTVNGATPSFSTNGNRSGMDFSADASQSILGELRACRGLTAVIVFSTTITTSQPLLGGTWTAGNTCRADVSAYRPQAFYPSASSGFTTETTSSGTPTVAAYSWSPRNNTCYANLQGSAGVSVTGSVLPTMNWAEIAIGRSRTTYYNGWISGVYLFSRPLHFVDNTNLQLLLDDLAATL